MRTSYYIFILIVLLFLNLHSLGQRKYKHNKVYRQEPSTYGMGIKFGSSFVMYDRKTLKFIHNPYLISWDILLFYRNLNVNLGSSLSFTYNNHIQKDIPYKDGILTNEQKLRLYFNSIKIGYSIKLRNNFTLVPYIGRLNYNIENEESESILYEKGYSFTIEANKWFLIDRPICIFIRNQFNITNLRKVNDNLGNIANIITIGIGGRFGKLK